MASLASLPGILGGCCTCIPPHHLTDFLAVWILSCSKNICNTLIKTQWPICEDSQDTRVIQHQLRTIILVSKMYYSSEQPLRAVHWTILMFIPAITITHSLPHCKYFTKLFTSFVWPITRNFIRNSFIKLGVVSLGCQNDHSLFSTESSL